MTYFLIGSKGRLGQAIKESLSDHSVVCLDRSVYSEWVHSNASDKVSRYFENVKHNNSTIIVTSGLLDPTVSLWELIAVNYSLPKNIIDGAAKLGIKVITFGTVMEETPVTKNNYVKSKILLNKYVRCLEDVHSSAIHIQLHTLFGLGQPSPFMFLGQILSALKENTLFRMTSGYQLREYHHVLDTAKAIKQINSSGLSGVIHLSHGKATTLKNIAEQIFAAFRASHLLRVGAVNEPLQENYHKTFEKTDVLKNMLFRDTLPAVVDYMKACYHHKALK
jgi:nucleoside-diphosphate-sugar epimerase